MSDQLAITADDSAVERKCTVVNTLTSEGSTIPVGSLIGVTSSSGTFNVITHEQLQLATNCNQFKGSILCVDGNNYICETRSSDKEIDRGGRSWMKSKQDDKNCSSVSANVESDVDARENDNNATLAPSAEWIESAQQSILSIRCKITNAELHKNKFGSGGRGRCIKCEGAWFTPSEFEAFSGRASSKDWKRSIRFGGRSLLALIECGILVPHATACTCSACCDDDSATGPIRLFTPYKRRRRYFDTLESGGKKSRKASGRENGSAQESDGEEVLETMAISEWHEEKGSASEWHGEQSYVQIKGHMGEDLVVGIPHSKQDDHESSIKLEKPVAPKPSYIPDDSNNKRTGDHPQLKKLEIMSEKMNKLAYQFRRTVDELKVLWRGGKDVPRKEEHTILKTHVSYEPREGIVPVHVVNTVEAVGLQPTTDNNENKKCANCNRDAFAECSMCRRTPYCSTFCQQKDWSVHQVECVREQPGSIMLIVESSDHVPQIMQK